MDELAYRIRSAEPDDLPSIRSTITVSLAHPEGRGRGTSLKTALQRGELLLLERYDTREKDWLIGGFVEFHMRVDDTLTIRDLGTLGETPHAGVAKHLMNELFSQLGPASATCVVRRDAEPWNEILASIPGFEVDGPPEYRRPHYYNIWKWSPELAREAQRGARQRGAPPRGGQRPGRRR
jgi:ribosomal protein S18 acetylase RimI-like enzyme